MRDTIRALVFVSSVAMVFFLGFVVWALMLLRANNL